MPKGGQNKMYDENTKCEFEGCDRKVKANHKCQAHDVQFRKHGVMHPIGAKVTRGGYQETKWCPKCKQHKNWRKFVMGLERPTDECRECYRERLLAVEEEKPPATLADVLAFIEKVTK